MIYKNFFKRIIDILVSLLLLLACAPLLLAVAVFIKLTSKGPIFFRQNRLGKGGRVFSIFKFRTLTHNPNRGNTGELYAGKKFDEYIPCGALLRRFKIDELPQFLNILLGDMSLIGPRPCLTSDIEIFDDNGRKRLEVLPGCTGLAQVSGCIYLPWPERWKYDAYYVDNLTFFLDLKIMIKTFAVVLLGEKKFVKK